jgi:hypothetical protein
MSQHFKVWNISARRQSAVHDASRIRLQSDAGHRLPGRVHRVQGQVLRSGQHSARRKLRSIRRGNLRSGNRPVRAIRRHPRPGMVYNLVYK